jgi:glutathione S-transferase
MLTSSPDSPGDPVHAKAIASFDPLMVETEARLHGLGPWWYGSEWSVMDVYLSWAYNVAASGDFDLSRFPAFLSHRAAVRARPSFQRALRHERETVDALGITFPNGFAL